MSQFYQSKKNVIILCLLLSSVSCLAGYDNHSNVPIKESHVEGVPKGSSIEATIDGHMLSIVFLENLGQVDIEVSLVGGGETQLRSTPTPNGVLFHIINTGSYIVTFTLENGDEYYGEFDVTD